jgi:hypothetical protein
MICPNSIGAGVQSAFCLYLRKYSPEVLRVHPFPRSSQKFKNPAFKQQMLQVDIKAADHVNQRKPRKRYWRVPPHSVVFITSTTSDWNGKIRCTLWHGNFRQGKPRYRN